MSFPTSYSYITTVNGSVSKTTATTQLTVKITVTCYFSSVSNRWGQLRDLTVDPDIQYYINTYNSKFLVDQFLMFLKYSRIPFEHNIASKQSYIHTSLHLRLLHLLLSNRNRFCGFTRHGCWTEEIRRSVNFCLIIIILNLNYITKPPNGYHVCSHILCRVCITYSVWLLT